MGCLFAPIYQVPCRPESESLTVLTVLLGGRMWTLGLCTRKAVECIKHRNTEDSDQLGSHWMTEAEEQP